VISYHADHMHYNKHGDQTKINMSTIHFQHLYTICKELLTRQPCKTIVFLNFAFTTCVPSLQTLLTILLFKQWRQLLSILKELNIGNLIVISQWKIDKTADNSQIFASIVLL